MKDSKRVMLRNSEITCFLACRQKWSWAYRECLTAKRDNAALFFGSMIHKALEIYYPPGRKRGPSPVKTVAQIWKEHLDQGGEEIAVKVGRSEDDEGSRVTAIELAHEMMTNYIDLYGKDDEYEVIASEQAFQLDVFSEDGKYLFTAAGEFDGIWKHLPTKKIGFAEHKTGATLDPFGAPYPLDPQSGYYWTWGPMWCKEVGILKKDDLDFILFNRMRKQFADQRPKNEDGLALNKDGTISKRQPPPLFKREKVYRSHGDLVNIGQRTKDVSVEIRAARKGKLAIIKNPDRHCGYCEFRDMCEVHETGSDWEAMKDMYVSWNPYDVHEAAGMGR